MPTISFRLDGEKQVRSVHLDDAPRCGYCNTAGHTRAECGVLKKRAEKVALRLAADAELGIRRKRPVVVVKKRRVAT